MKSDQKFWHTFKFLFTCVILSLTTILIPNLNATVDNSETAALLNRIVDKNGGQAAMQQIHTWKFTGQLKKGDNTYNALLIRKKPNKVRLNISNDNMRIIVAYDGKTAWTQSDVNGTTNT